MIADFLSEARTLVGSTDRVSAVGVSIGGPLNTRTGEILSPPHLPGWDGVPLPERITGSLGLPVVVEHDAAACLEAEWLWGAAAGTTHAAYLTCGTGCGAGVMIDRRILRGPRGQSPEAGHIRLAPDGPALYGKRGCVESFCSGTGIAQLASWLKPDAFPHPVDTKRLKELADLGNDDAGEVLLESARRTGQLCAILSDLFALQVIVLGSLALYFGEAWLEDVRSGFREEALESNALDTRVVPSALAGRLQDLSAIAPVVFRNSDAGAIGGNA
jgi:glucokinase